MFELHAQLAADCVELGEFSLSKVLLCKDSLYPWLILVPKVAGIEEIYQLSEPQQQLLLTESSQLAAFMQTYFKADKMNIAALGNMVPQLHIHHIARFKSDKAWPKPIWGAFPAEPYTQEQLEKITFELQKSLKIQCESFSF